ncbi:MAG: PKD domain-containing protein [Acidobacteriota bacterium]
MIGSGRSQNFLSVVLVSLLVLGIAPGQTASPAAFAFAPNGSPVVGQAVQFNDTSANGATSWLWDFGDGHSSTDRNPTHVFGAPGVFQVALTVTAGGISNRVTQEIVVSAADTLQFDNRGSHAFTVKLTATDPRSGRTASGQAIPQNDLFGYFAIPAFTGSPENPEVFVKILDGRAVNGEFWVFYGHLTDLAYDLTVTEVATGISKTYHKDAGNSVGGFDTSGFHAEVPGPTPTVPAATPTPAPSPTPPAVVTVNLVASDFRWEFDGGGDSFTFRVGQPYQLRIRRSNGSHGFSGISAFGCSGASLSSASVCNFTPTAAQVGTHGFACTVSSCGVGHSSMLNGRAVVVP